MCILTNGKMKTYFSILVIFYVILESDIVQGTKTLQFTIYHDDANGGDLKCIGDPLYVNQFEEFALSVSFPTIYKNARCGKSDTSYYHISMERKDGQYVAEEVFKQQIRGTWDFKCIFFTNYCNNVKYNTCFYGAYFYPDKGVNCKTKIIVLKPGENAVNVDGYLLANTQRFPSSSGIQEYKFYDREGTVFACSTNNGSRVKLTYETLAGESGSTNYIESNHVSMYMKLIAAQHGTKIECIILGDHVSHIPVVITVKLTLIKDKRKLSLEVNGMIPPRYLETSHHTFYEYKYYNKENITLALVKDKEMYGEPICISDASESFKWLDDTLLKFTCQGETDTTINCTILQKNTAINKNIQIKFLFDPEQASDFSIIPMNDILVKYYTDSHHKILHYKIKGFEMPSTLAPVFGPQADYINVISPVPVESAADFNEPKDEILNELHTGLAYPGQIVTTGINITASMSPATLKPDTMMKPSEDTPTKSSSSDVGRKLLIAAMVILVLSLVTVTTWLAFSYYKKIRTLKNRPLDTDSHDFSEDLKGSTESHRQWIRPDDVTYTKPLEDLYSKPIPKSERTNKAKLIGSKNGTYVNVLKQLSEPHYATVQNCNSEMQTATLDLSQPHSNSTQKTASPSSESQYQNLDGHESHEMAHLKANQLLPQKVYASLQNLNNESCCYVNNIVTDEIEPTYCELTKNK